jgi:hypothetical protein
LTQRPLNERFPIARVTKRALPIRRNRIRGRTAMVVAPLVKPPQVAVYTVRIDGLAR